jgi:transcriptional regulator with XRE-family HTH domain
MRHDIYVSGLAHGYRGVPRWRDPYHCEWSIVVGDRVRRIRRSHDLTLKNVSDVLHRPYGGQYSVASLSRLERGWASSPLYVYLAVADVLAVEPGRLLGPDDAERPVSEPEAGLLSLLRRVEMAPEEAIARLFRLRQAIATEGS